MWNRILGIIMLVLLAAAPGCVGQDKIDLSEVEQGLVNPPTNLTANVVSGYQVDLSWTGVAGADYYIILRGSASGNETTYTTTPASPTTFRDDHLDPNTQYSYQVQAVINSESSPPSNEVLFTTPNGIAAPLNVTASAVSTSRIEVNWDPAAGASKYYVFQGPGGGPRTYVTTVSGTNYVVTGLAPGTTLSFTIASGDDANRVSPESNVATATTPSSNPTLSPPSNVTATATSSSRIEVGWTSVSGAVKYYVFQAVGAGPFNYVATTTGTAYTATGLAASTTYSYVIQSVDFFDSASADSAPPATATTFADGASAVTAPTGVTATAVSASRIQVGWNAVTNAVKYYVFQAQGAGPFTYVGTVNSPSTSYLATGLAPSTTYSYVVQAVDFNDIASPNSTPPASATTFAAGLGARLKFDEQTGTIANDSIGSYTGTLTGGASFTTTNRPPVYDEDFHNYSHISIPGGTGDAVTFVEESIFQFADDFSVSFWVNLASAGGTTHLMGKRAAGCGTTQWELYVDGAGLHLANASSTLDFGQGLTAGQWTQVGITYEAGTAHLFVNGLETAQGAFVSSARQPGDFTFGNAGGCGNASAMLLDELRFYTQALSSVEMGRLGIRPAPPQNMVGVVRSSTAVDLSWDPIATADLYVIYRGTASGNQTPYTSIPSSQPFWAEDHLMPSETTSWNVRVFVDGLISEPSNEVILTSNPPPPPPSSVSVVANETDANRAEVSWSAVTNAQKYYVFRSVNGGGFIYVNTVVAPGLSYSDAGLTSGSTYAYQIVTVDNGNTLSTPSASASITIP